MEITGASLGPPVQMTKPAAKDVSEAREPGKKFADVLKDKSDDPKVREPSENPKAGKNEQQEAQGSTKSEKDSKPRESEKQETQSESQTVKSTGKLTSRQKVMRKFMDSMESELSIPPEKLAEAMTRLNDSQLVKAPEETVGQIIEKLDLDPEDTERAESLYLAMVTELSGIKPQAQDVPAILTPEQKAVLGSATGAALLQAQERRQALSDSLEKMNSRFFMKPEMKMPNEIVAEKPMPQGKIPVDTVYGRENVKPVIPEMQKQTMSEDLMKKLAAVGVTAGALKEAMEKMPMQAQPQQLQQQAESVPLTKEEQALLPQQQSLIPAMKAAIPVAAGAQFQSGQDSLDDKDEKTADFFVHREAAPERNLHVKEDFAKLDPKALGAGGAMAMADKSDSAPANNIQALMKQAQYVLRKGGGEATVQMSPEGMGQVHLKIAVQDGKVNLELQTETKEAKKMIESSLHDLKTSLNIHKMAVDQVKVDVNTQLGGQSQNNDQNTQQQNQMNFKPDMQREQARNFFSQFREDNAGRRDGFYETSGVKAYSRGTSTAPLGPATEAASTRRYQGSGKGTGLDLVA